jgi:hypothetical protein
VAAAVVTLVCACALDSLSYARSALLVLDAGLQALDASSAAVQSLLQPSDIDASLASESPKTEATRRIHAMQTRRFSINAIQLLQR